MNKNLPNNGIKCVIQSLWSSFYVYRTLCLYCVPVSLARYIKVHLQIGGELSSFGQTNQLTNVTKCTVFLGYLIAFMAEFFNEDK